MAIQNDNLYAYSVATELLKFRDAWQRLVQLTAQDPDLDLTQAYPFGMQEFEDMLKSVVVWCQVNAKKLIDTYPLYVRNPDCIMYCKVWKSATVTLDNVCSNQHLCSCTRYPLVPFDAQRIRASIENIHSHVFAEKYDMTKDLCTPEAIYDAYQQLISCDQLRRKQSE